jgi:GT2 family glycosyltransferase
VNLGVVVLSYGIGGEYVPLLESLAREGVARETIVLVHNPSARDEPAPDAGSGCEVIAAGHNLGYAAGMNLGLRRQLELGREGILVLTHDARFRDGALRRMLEAAQDNPRHGALGPTLVLVGTETPFSFGGAVTPRGELFHRHELGAVDRGLSECDWLDGGTILFRAAALDRVGCYDERLWSYVEDADLCLRISRAGFGVAVVVGALADQEPGMSKRFGPWAYLITRNRIAYARRFGGWRCALRSALLNLARGSRELGRAAVRRLGLRPGEPTEPYAIAIGTLRGIADFCRGRWGPPPAGLPGGGDIRNVEPGGGDGG